MYHLVQFEDGTAIINENWLVEKQNNSIYCKFPTRKYYNKIMEFLQNKTPPCDSWPLAKGSIIYSHGEF